MRLISVVIFFIFFGVLLYAASDLSQPPFETPGHALTENFRKIYYAADELSSRLETMISNGVVNIKDSPYNAKCDGATDDAVSIQAALDTGKNVYVPAGTCYVGSGVTISTEGQTFFGAGQGLSIITANTAINMLTISARYIHVEKLGFYGGGQALRAIYVTTPKPYIADCTISYTSSTAIELLSFTNYIYHNNIFTNYGYGIKLSVGGNNNNTNIIENVISNNGKHGIWVTAGSPSFTSGVFIRGNSMENNCSSGTATTVYAHIFIEGGTAGVYMSDNYHESDIAQTGFNKQLFYFLGQGATRVTLRDTYMFSSASNKFEYYVEVGTSSYPVAFENDSMLGWSSGPVHDFSGVSGRVAYVWVSSNTNQPEPFFNIPGSSYISGNETISGNSNVVGTIESTGTITTRSTSGLAVTPLASGDALTQYNISGGASWAAGADDSDSDAYVLSKNSTLGTNNRVRVSTNGWVNQASQPSFLATAPVNTTNVTGDGTTATVEYDTEIFDQDSNYDAGSTYIFTAPITGRYTCSACVLVTNVDASHTGTAILTLVTSNRDYILEYAGNANTASFGSGNVWLNGSSSEVDMDAADTAKVTVRIAGGTKTVEPLDSADFNKFSCSLIN